MSKHFENELRIDFDLWEEEAPKWAVGFACANKEYDGFFISDKDEFGAVRTFGLEEDGLDKEFKISYSLISDREIIRKPFPDVGFHGVFSFGSKVEWLECVVLEKHKIAYKEDGDWYVESTHMFDNIEFKYMRDGK